MRTRTTPLLVAAAVVATATAGLTACGAPGEAGDAAVADPEYHVHASIEQREGREPTLCIGPMPGIDPPPPCGGPTVAGLDWAAVPDAVSTDGTTTGRAHLVGTYADRTLTLTRPPATESPLAQEAPDPFAPASHDPLCTDPWRGGDEASAADPEHGEARNSLATAAQGLPGYVSTYVSDGRDEINVVLATGVGDAEAAHASLREVWAGWLCVATRDLPTDADLQAASSAVVEIGQEIGLHWSGLAVGVLDVSVVVADPATLEAVHEAVAPWLTPDQVRVAGDLQPLP